MDFPGESGAERTMRITDLRRASALAHAHRALVVVDNTFLTPYWQRPLELGERLHFLQNSLGAVLPPFDSWLLLRGLKTLAVRMERHETNGRAVAAWLTRHPKVTRVLYPGLPDHPGYATHIAQAGGFGGMISFEVESDALADHLLRRVKLITLAESLGAAESLISLPAKMTHASVPPERRAQLGISDRLVRLSVGLDRVEDLLADLEQALA